LTATGVALPATAPQQYTCPERTTAQYAVSLPTAWTTVGSSGGAVAAEDSGDPSGDGVIDDGEEDTVLRDRLADEATEDVLAEAAGWPLSHAPSATTNANAASIALPRAVT
jgi:hypothetical protein